MEHDLPDPEILFSCVCTPGVMYTRPRRGVWRFRGEALERNVRDVCWPIVYGPMVLGDPW